MTSVPLDGAKDMATHDQKICFKHANCLCDDSPWVSYQHFDFSINLKWNKYAMHLIFNAGPVSCGSLVYL